MEQYCREKKTHKGSIFKSWKLKQWVNLYVFSFRQTNIIRYNVLEHFTKGADS